MLRILRSTTQINHILIHISDKNPNLSVRGGLILLSGLTGIGQLVKGFSGDDVLLPCSYSKIGELSAIPAVFWLDQDDKVVLKIKKNLTGNTFATSFPEEYKKGNFSILVKNAQPSHSGLYFCSIPSVDYSKKIQLNVSG